MGPWETQEREMGYGAPWERGAVDVPNTIPLRDLEVPGLVPGADGSRLSAKQARRYRCQRGRRRRRQEEKSSRKERSWVDRDCCLVVIAEAVRGDRQELDVISRWLDLCKSTLAPMPRMCGHG